MSCALSFVSLKAIAIAAPKCFNVATHMFSAAVYSMISTWSFYQSELIFFINSISYIVDTSVKLANTFSYSASVSVSSLVIASESASSGTSSLVSVLSD